LGRVGLAATAYAPFAAKAQTYSPSYSWKGRHGSGFIAAYPSGAASRREPAIVEAVLDQLPAFTGLALDIGL
jgi:hypothetical protein